VTLATAGPTPTVDPAIESAVRQARDAFARTVGERPEDVHIRNVDWASYLNEGGHVLVHIGADRGTSALSLSDYGWDESVLTKEQRTAILRTMKLGTGYYLPPEILAKRDSIENKARKRTKDAAIPQTRGEARGDGYFIPERRAQCYLCGSLEYPLEIDGTLADHAAAMHPDADQTVGREKGWLYREWKSDMDKLKRDYYALCEYIRVNWDDLVNQVRVNLAIVGHQNYERLAEVGRAPMVEREEWVLAFIERRMKRAPTRDEFCASWYFTYTVSYHPLALQMAQDQADAARVLADTNSYNAMMRDKAATLQAEVENGAKKFGEQTVAYLSNLMYEVVLPALEAIQKNGEVPGASVRALKNVYKVFSEIKFFPDERLDAQLADVQKIISSGSLVDRTREVRNVLTLIAAESRLLMMQMGTVPKRSAQHVHVPDTIRGLEIVTAGRRPAAIGAANLDLRTPVNAGRRPAAIKGSL
jgi:hypothetical protein